MTSEDHNKYVSYAFLGYAGANLLMLLFMMLIFLAAMFDGSGMPLGFFFVFSFAMIFVMAIFTLPSAIAGWAGLKKKKWARTAGIVAAITSVTSMPLGTLAGIYGLWFYFGDAWKEIYESDEFIQRGELPGREDFARWEADAARYEREKDTVPPQGEWR